MATDAVGTSGDWLSSWHTSLVAWWIPQAAVLAGLLVPAPIRAVLWTIALIWMGAACILNARRCGRTHCRYTGPYYLAMIAPVLVLASGIVTVDFYGWLVLAVLILAGSKIIWWATERAWGKFS
jgi:hypothetical protein